jgi:hypothetical protein
MQIFNVIALVLASIATLCVAVSAWTYPILSYDPYWLLAMGRDYAHGMDPSIDHYSFTYPKGAVAGNYHYFGMIFYWLTDHYGLDGAARILRISTLFIICFIALKMLSYRRFPVFASTALVLIVSGLQYRYFLRPELFDYIFVATAFYLYYKALAGITNTKFLQICLLMMLWNNYHASILGYVIFFGLYSQLFVESFYNREAKRWLARHLPQGVFLIALGFANPELAHPVLDAVNFSSEWSSYIDEHLPFKSKFNFANDTSVYFLWPLSLLVTLICLRTGHIGAALVILVFAFSAWERVRMLSFLAEVLGFTLAMSLRPRRIFYSARTAGTSSNWLAYSGLVLVMGIFAYISLQRTLLLQDHQSSLPKQITSYITSKYLEGNILNSLHFGGWLTYKLPEGMKVFIDGRTNILYPLEHLKTSHLIEVGDTRSLTTTLEDFPVDYILIRNNKRSFSNIILNSSFRPEYTTSMATLYSQAASSITLSSVLSHFPMCWHPELATYLREEQDWAAANYLQGSSFPDFVRMLSDLNIAIDSPGKLKELSNIEKRAVAYALTLKQQPALAYEVLDSVSDRTNLDLVTQSYMALAAENWRQVKIITLMVFSGMWSELINPNAPEFTLEQKAALKRMAATAMQMQKDSQLDTQLLKSPMQNRLEADSAIEDIIFMHREHCPSLIETSEKIETAPHYENIRPA